MTLTLTPTLTLNLTPGRVPIPTLTLTPTLTLIRRPLLGPRRRRRARGLRLQASHTSLCILLGRLRLQDAA